MNAAGSPGPLDVLIIGAGFSGICLGKILRDEGITRFRIVDKAPRVGGTWFWNSYPGAACDVMSHFYCFSFAPNPDWTRKYSPWDEILAYAERCADEFGLRPHLELGREVTESRFDDASGTWVVQFADGGRLEACHVIDGTGGLHVPLTPAIPGRGSFSGESWHSSQWRHDVDLAGKRVAIVGSAASAIQIAPTIAGVADNVTVFQRTANWILPRDDRRYPGWLRRTWRRIPGLLKAYRLFLLLRYDGFLYSIVRSRDDTPLRRLFARRARRYLQSNVADPGLRRQLTPEYRMGCKRILISDDYYQAIGRGEITLETRDIESITPSGLRLAGGSEHAADVIVYATGFDTQGHHLDARVSGPGGICLSETWQDAPMAYEGVMVAGFPNYYLVTGPNSGVGTTSVIFMIEQAARLIIQCIRAAGREHLVAPTRDAMRRYDREIQTALADTVWTTDCRSWYKRADGRVTALYPWNGLTWRRRHRLMRQADFEFRPRLAAG